MYKKRPSKDELYQKISALEKENRRLSDTLVAEQRKEWERMQGAACTLFHKTIDEIFPNMVYNAKFEHVDAAGYWFTFELVNDNRVQTYCVRHSDLYA